MHSMNGRVVGCHPATAERWDDLVAVMGTRGDPSRCWCQYFRLRGRDWAASAPEQNRAAMRSQVRGEPPPPGVIAYTADEPVGWCAVAPKSAYPRVLSSAAGDLDPEGIWSVTCFVVRVGHRRQGVAAALLDAAVDLARTHGARRVEGYPVDPDRRTRVSSADLYHGTLRLFLDAGFSAVDRPWPTRVKVERVLG